MLCDCDFEVGQHHLEMGERLELRVRLPGVVDFYGVPYAKAFQSDHHHYRNGFGSFFFACCGHGSFYTENPGHRNMSHHFRTLNRWDEEYGRFRVYGYDPLTSQLRRDMPKEEVIRAIRSDLSLSTHFHFFFRWINQFVVDHGQERFHKASRWDTLF